MGSNPIWGSDCFCVLLWFILYISLYFLYKNLKLHVNENDTVAYKCSVVIACLWEKFLLNDTKYSKELFLRIDNVCFLGNLFFAIKTESMGFYILALF